MTSPRSRAIVMAGLVGAASVLLLGVGAAQATPAVSPASGPTAGGTTVSVAAPALGFTQFGGGQTNVVALGNDGQVYVWGDNGNGALGNGGTTNSLLPLQVAGGALPAGVTITAVGSAYHSGFAATSDGRIFSWGANGNGQLGDGTTTGSKVPVQVLAGAIPSGVTITQIVGDEDILLALGSDGHVYSWGYNHAGALGDGTNVDSFSPVQVLAGAIPSGVTITQVAVGFDSSYALGSDGHVYSWGSNSSGELGDGTGSDSNVPVAVTAGAIPSGVTIVSIAAQQIGAYALGSNGRVYSWGYNGLGELGDGTNTTSNVPVAVAPGAIPAGVTLTAIGASSASGYAAGSDGHIYSWGYNASGQLGNASNSDSNAPVPVSAGAIPSGVTATQLIGTYHAGFALGSDGAIYAWGDGSSGQHGDGTTADTNTPVLGPNIAVSSVTFGGVAGTALAVSNGTASVVSPAHTAGAVTVDVVGALRGGATATAVTVTRSLAAAFTFEDILPVTGGSIPWALVFAAAVSILLGSALVRVGQARPFRN